MAQEAHDPEAGTSISRRVMLRSVGAAVGAAVLAPRLAGAQTPPSGPVAPPSTVTSPPRDFGPRGAPTTYFTDPDVLTVEPAFNGLRQPNAPIQRLWTGALWSEGPAWSSAGPLSRVERHPEQPAAPLARGRRARQRVPHAVEQQQRQHVRLPGPPALLRAPHPARGALRARRLGDRHRGMLQRQAAQLAQRRGAASGRQLLVHRPALRRPSSTRARWTRRAGPPTWRAGSTRGSASRPSSAATSASCPTAVYRVDPSGARRPVVAARIWCRIPTGSCFSPDYKKLYVISTGKGPGDTHAGGKGEMYVFDVGADNKLSNGKLFSNFMVDGVKCGPDGVRCRRGRQSLVLQQCGPQRGLQRRDGVDAAGPAHRAHPAARDLRQRLLRRPQAQPPLHGRQPVPLRGLHRHAGRRPRLTAAGSGLTFQHFRALRIRQAR